MTRYRMVVKDVIARADILLEIVDARFPEETRNRDAEGLVVKGGKKFIIVMNKSDLAPPLALEAAKQRLLATAPTVIFSCKERKGARAGAGAVALLKLINDLAPIEGRDTLVGVLGYPNTGKSSVINLLAGRHKAPTSSISGHTKGVQLVRADAHIMLLDTPGVIPVLERDEVVQGLLSVKDATHIKDPVGVAMKIIERISEERRSALEKFYKVELEGLDSYDSLLVIGKAINCLRKGGEVDEPRAAVRIINDWQKGLLRL